ncbi:MAG: hypothetical protein M1836_004109 [Candelina mexicana]|nr:MAG: hypothetical protein M1836_004109 [Candelina mexicana]
MATVTQASKDHWSAEAYTASASFVPQLGSKVLSYLDPQRGEKIIDLGCGDGVLTKAIADCHVGFVLGLDSSPNLIAEAFESNMTYGLMRHTYEILDCRHLEKLSVFREGSWDKVFSNAALHWILRDETTRQGVFENVFKLLKPGGIFAFEMGGKGNVAEVHTALIAALVHQGLSFEQAREASPWFFPSEEWMTEMLTGVGFEIVRMEMEYRPTQLTTEKGGGLEGWVRLMGANFLDQLATKGKRDKAVVEVCEVLESVIKREEDSSMWLGYNRLRVVAKKPSAIV